MRKEEKQTKSRFVFFRNGIPSPRIPKPNLFLLFGIFFLILWGVVTFHKATALSFSSTNPIIEQPYSSSSDIPSSITIPTLSLTLPTFEASITNGIWQIHDHGVSHLSSSQNPGEDGNSIFYAHNTDDLFGKLTQIKKGDAITVLTKDQNIFSYVVTSIQTVNPTDVDVLTMHEGETITLYTCTGFADLKRLVVKAKKQDTLSLR